MTSMGNEGLRGAVDAVHRWLAAHQNVVVRGDDGSGRTSALEATLAAASRRRVASIMLRAGGTTRFGPITSHPSAPSGAAPDESALVEWLSGELRGPGALLLLDDVTSFDEGTVSVALQAVRRTRCAVVLSSSVDLARSGPAFTVPLVAHCAPAEVRLLPLGFTAMTGLLTSALGAAPEVALVSAVTVRSAGNPRVALALVRAAQFSGAIELVGGRWTKVRPLDESPLDAVAHAMMTRLDDQQVKALELVAWLGAVTAAGAARLLEPAAVAGLLSRGRLVSYQLGTEPQALVVSPPALASALRQRLGRQEIAALAAHVTACGSDVTVPLGRTPGRGGSQLMLADTPDEGAVYKGTSPDIASLMHERAASREVAAREAWRTDPSLRTANAYLERLMRRPVDSQIAAVFRDTRRTPDDSPDEQTLHTLMEARWASWRGESRDEVCARLGARACDVQPFLSFDDLRDDAVRAVVDGADDDQLLALPDESRLPYVLRGWSVVARAAALLEAGRPDLAVRVCAAAEGVDLLPEIHHYLDGVRGESLLMLGEAREAELLARRCLEASIESMDALGIRVHACVLTQILMFTGRPQSAWRVISTSLRIGPAGPLENVYDRRALVLGASLQVRFGGLSVAQILLSTLDSASNGSRPRIRSLRALAHAALEVAQGNDEEAAGHMWERGRLYAEKGLLQPALLCWLLSATPMDESRLATVRAAYEKGSMRMLAPYLRLHEAIASEDLPEIAAAFADGRSLIASGLVRTATALVEEHRYAQSSAAPPQDSAGQPTDLGGHMSLQIEMLTSREREVALLARAGLSNRQIANQLVLSVRTVENHMSRVLRKLGFTSRADLAHWAEV